jgi:rhodanese-related sulfurtransferase
LLIGLLEDHIGGHIKGSMHVPSASFDAMLPTLLRKLEDKDTVVFHCALSQQRGPGAALRYIRAKEDQVLAELPRSGPSKDTEAEAIAAMRSPKKPQKVFVLDRGFVGWQEVFGEDETLTEGYIKDLWKDGYV